MVSDETGWKAYISNSDGTILCRTLSTEHHRSNHFCKAFTNQLGRIPILASCLFNDRTSSGFKARMVGLRSRFLVRTLHIGLPSFSIMCVMQCRRKEARNMATLSYRCCRAVSSNMVATLITSTVVNTPSLCQPRIMVGTPIRDDWKYHRSFAGNHLQCIVITVWHPRL